MVQSLVEPPPLAERLAVLGFMPRVPTLRPTASAASCFLGDRLDHYLGRLSAEWWEHCEADWEAQAQRMCEAGTELSLLERTMATRDLETEGTCEAGRAGELLARHRGGDTAGSRVARERDPDHVLASWRVARAALEAGDAGGLSSSAKSSRLEWRAIPASISAIRDAAERRVIETAPELEHKLEQLAKTTTEPLFRGVQQYHSLRSARAPRLGRGCGAASDRRRSWVSSDPAGIPRAQASEERSRHFRAGTCGSRPRPHWTSVLFATDFGAEARLLQELADRVDMSELVMMVSLSGNRLLKNRMKHVSSAILVDRSRYDLSLPSPRYNRRAALAGFAALGLGGALALDGTLGWPGSRRALAWALSPSGPKPSPSRLPLVLHEGLFAMAPLLSTVHGGLNAAYRAHAALDAALATAVGHWQGRQEQGSRRGRDCGSHR